MRNILGERVLGLPKEPDTSRELPVESTCPAPADRRSSDPAGPDLGA